MDRRKKSRPIHAIECVSEVNFQSRQTLASVIGNKITEGMGDNLDTTFCADAIIVASKHGSEILFGSQAETITYEPAKRITTRQWTNAPI